MINRQEDIIGIQIMYQRLTTPLNIYLFTEQNLADRDILRECFKALEIKVDSANKKLVGLKKKLSENARFRREVILKVENLKQVHGFIFKFSVFLIFFLF